MGEREGGRGVGGWVKGREGEGRREGGWVKGREGGSGKERYVGLYSHL